MSSSLRFQSLLFLTFTTSLSLPSITTNTKPQRMVTRLIHRDSIFSPFYNPNDTITDRAQRILSSSNARFAYLQSEAKRPSATDYGQAYILADKHAFLVKFYIGQPPVPQLAIMDTGSNLLWVQCKPCKTCYKQKSPIFDSKKSSTYVNLQCWDDSCQPSLFCAGIYLSCDYIDNNCIYSIKYADNATTKGYIATEQITFETSNEETTVIPDVAFGCGQENVEKLHGQWGGVFGLGNSPKSMVNRLGGRFSYCIGKINDPQYSFNHLTLGDGAIVGGYSTPFEKDKGLYYITLEGISVGQERLDIDANLFKKTWRGGGVILDSGAELTYLPEVAYNIIREKFLSLLDGFLRQYVYEQDAKQLCYRGIVSQDLQGLPVMTFHLAGGADLVLDAGSLFYNTEENVFCISMLPVKSNNKYFIPRSIIGMLAQQYYNVAYDLKEKKIYFQRIDCELLDD